MSFGKVLRGVLAPKVIPKVGAWAWSSSVQPRPKLNVGDCQNYGPFLGPYKKTGPNLGDPKRDHNFDNPPCNFNFVD